MTNRIGNLPISRLLDTVGDGSGTKNAIGNYADAGLGATDFKIAPSASEQFHISRLIVALSDAGSLDAESYGNGITLTNGIQVALKDGDGVIQLLTDTDDPVKSNAAWGHYCFDTHLSAFGVGNEHFYVRWSFDKFSKLQLDGAAGEFLAVTLNDDFSGLLQHRFTVQGYVLGT